MNTRTSTMFAVLLAWLATSCASQGDKISFDRNLKGFAYPFPVSSYQFKSQRQNLEMSYMDIGGKEKGKVAVLLHGKNFSGYYWERVAKDLVKKGYRVVIPDQIGFGKSSKPEYYQYSFSQLALNTHKLLGSLNIGDYILVGHSMGGMLAVHMASMFEEVKKLVLVNPIGLEKYLEYVEYKDPQFFYQSEVKKTVEDARNYQKKNYYDGKWSPEYEELLAPFKGWRNGPDWELIAWNNALTYDPIFRDEIVSKLQELEVPTHLILGVRDRTGPGRGWKKKGVERKLGLYDKLGKARASENKNIKLYELKGLGHMPHFEDYEAFSQAFYPQF